MKYGELTQIIIKACAGAFTTADEFTSTDIANAVKKLGYKITVPQLSSALNSTTKPTSQISQILVRVGNSCPHHYRLRTIIKKAPAQKEHSPLELGQAIIAYIQDLQAKAGSQGELAECIDENEKLKREIGRLKSILHGKGIKIPI